MIISFDWITKVMEHHFWSFRANSVWSDSETYTNYSLDGQRLCTILHGCQFAAGGLMNSDDEINRLRKHHWIEPSTQLYDGVYRVNGWAWVLVGTRHPFASNILRGYFVSSSSARFHRFELNVACIRRGFFFVDKFAFYYRGIYTFWIVQTKQNEKKNTENN